MDDRLDEELAEDHSPDVSVGQIFTSICEDLGIQPDWSKVPDDVLPSADYQMSPEEEARMIPLIACFFRVPDEHGTGPPSRP